MSEVDNPGATCDLCKASLADGRRWVLLNRYGVGANKRNALVSVKPGETNIWDVSDEKNAFATGALLCYPACLLTWIEGKLIEIESVPI